MHYSGWAMGRMGSIDLINITIFAVCTNQSYMIISLNKNVEVQNKNIYKLDIFKLLINERMNHVLYITASLSG